MFQRIHNISHRLRTQFRFPLSSKGQTAIVLILMIAIALILYSATLNWGRVSQYKTMVTVASNTAASQMASLITSYGEQQLQVVLGGRVEYCKRTNFLVLLVTFIIAVIIAYIAGPQSGVAFWVAVTGAVLAGLAVVVHLTVVEPGLTRLWNKMHANLPLDGQVIESAIMGGMQNVVSDQSRIYDHFDMDTDGLWVNNADSGSIPERKDKISRFAFYYTKRLQTAVAVNRAGINDFMTGLKEFLYDNPSGSATPDNFGIFDPVCVGDSPKPYCNPCCQPQFEPDGATPLRPESCTAVQIAACGSGDYPGTAYPYQYDPARENFDNAFHSFREQLGVDDENKIYHRNAINPNTPPPQTLAGTDFRPEDATGFYTADMQASIPIVGGTPDKRLGVFPFFWSMKNLLPAQPNSVNIPPIYPIMKTDGVIIMTANPATCTLASCPNNFVIPEDQCSSVVGYDAGMNTIKTDGFYWKSGSDEFCSTTYPYNDCVGRDGNCSDGAFGGTLPACGCEAASSLDHLLWRDDTQDNLVWGLKEFSLWAQSFVKSDIDKLNKEFASWYPKAAFWIAPKCPAAAGCSTATPADPITCRFCNNETNDGLLIVWRGVLAAWVDLLDTWLYKTTFSDDSAWCLPTAATAAAPTLPEQALLPIERSALPSQNPSTPIPTDRNGANMPPIWGDLNDTIACLNFNLTNVTKLTNCQTTCLANPANFDANANACLNLPRSTIDLKNSSAIPASNTAYQNAQRLQDCLSSTCQDSFGATLPVCVGLPGVVVAPNCTAFGPGNAFFDAVKAERNNQFDISNYCEPPPGNTTAFQANIVRALAVANVQESMFTTRHAELTYIRDGLDVLPGNGAVGARNTFLNGFIKFDAFLKPCSAGLPLGQGCNSCVDGGPAAQLICARRSYDPSTDPNQLSNFVIYGWQSKPISGRGPTGTDPDHGYWHLIRVEAFAPKRCYGQCGTDALPNVQTRTSGGIFNRKRCYFLADREGTVIARVTRYDEDRDSPGARFVNNQLIWKYRFTNPGVPSAATPGNVLTVNCKHPAAYNVGVSASTRVELDGAFMINKPPPDVDDTCWSTVNALLAKGVQTTTCAKYYYDPDINHMSLKFTTCDQGKVNVATGCAANPSGC